MKKLLIVIFVLLLSGCHPSNQAHYDKLLRLYENQEYIEALRYANSNEKYILHHDAIAEKIFDLKTKIKDTLISIKLNEVDNCVNPEIYLGFKLGMSEKEYEDHAKILISKNELTRNNTLSNSVGRGAYAEQSNAYEYKHDFYTEYNKFTAILVPYFIDEKLVHLQVSLLRDKDKDRSPHAYDLLWIYREKYGKEEPKEIIDLFYSEEEQKSIVFFWQKSKLAIFIQEADWPRVIINYVDLETKVQMNKLREFIEDVSKEHHTNMAKEQINNI